MEKIFRKNKTIMSEVIHFFYFIADDEEALNTTWRLAKGRYGVSDSALNHFAEEGPVLSRLATGEGVSLSISVLEHTAILQISLRGAEPQEKLSSLNELREELGDILLDLIGESSFIVQSTEEESSAAKKIIQIKLPGDRKLLVTHSPETGDPRLYTFVTEEPGEAAQFLLQKLAPLDCQTYQINREIDYYTMQHDAFVAQEEELNSEIGRILYRREADLSGLETDVEKTAEIFAMMANYSVLLSNSLRVMRGDLNRLERLVRKGLHQREDDYFMGRHGLRLKQFISTLETSQRNFSRSLDNAKAAIDVMKSRVDLANSRTNLDLQQQLGSLMHQNVAIQEESLIMGIAATMVEFFVVLYYGLGVWKMLAGEEVVHHIPVSLKAGLIVGFSLAVVAGTHKAAKALKEKTFKETLAWSVIILTLVAIMAAVSILYAH